MINKHFKIYHYHDKAHNVGIWDLDIGTLLCSDALNYYNWYWGEREVDWKRFSTYQAFTNYYDI